MTKKTSRKRGRRVGFQPTARGLLVHHPTKHLRKLLRTIGFRLQKDDANGTCVGTTGRPLFDDLSAVAEENLIQIPWSLVPVLAAWVRMPIPTGIVPTLRVLPDTINGLGIESRFIDQMRATRAMTIVHATSIKPSQIIAQAALAFPQAKIAVSIMDRKVMREILNELRDSGIRSRSVYQQNEESAAHVVVGPPLLHDVTQGHSFVFTVGSRTALHVRNHGRSQVMHLPHARHILLLPADRRLSPSEWDRLSAIFGFDRLYLPQFGYRQRRACIAWQSFSSQPGSSRKSFAPLQLKESGLWRNPIRNRLIAKIAKDFARDSAGTVAPFVPSLGVPPSVRGIVVLVEGITHAVEVARYLPGWSVLHHKELQLDDLWDWERAVLNGQNPDASDKLKLIVTAAAASAVPWQEIDVVVRADGGPGMPAIKRKDLIVPVELDRPLLVCDLNDRHHPIFRKWTRERQAAYEKNEWFREDCDPSQERIRLAVNQEARVRLPSDTGRAVEQDCVSLGLPYRRQLDAAGTMQAEVDAAGFLAAN